MYSRRKILQNLPLPYIYHKYAEKFKSMGYNEGRMFAYFLVREQSMAPTCQEGDFVLVNRMSYLFSCPRIGHIIVLKDPRDSPWHIVKRICAIKDSFVWVEGDNKEKSTDSRNFGWVGKEYIVGKVWFVGRPPRLKNECGGTPTLIKHSSRKKERASALPVLN